MAYAGARRNANERSFYFLLSLFFFTLNKQKRNWTALFCHGSVDIFEGKTLDFVGIERFSRDRGWGQLQMSS